MTNTTNLGLTQYDTTDKINFVTEYNSDMEKIDIAVGNNADLDTTDTSSLVNAINENVANTASNVITSGSNTNGSWTKFPDGTIEIYGSFTTTTTAGGGFGINFPEGVTSILANRFSEVNFNTVNKYYSLRFISGETTSTLYCIAYKYVDNSILAYSPISGYYHVIGRWKQ